MLTSIRPATAAGSGRRGEVMRRIAKLARAAGLVAGLSVCAGPGGAQSPQFVPDSGLPAGQEAAQQQADITRPYAVTPQAGPWLICATSYTGHLAPQLAVQLAEHIRTQHHVPTYIYNLANEERRRMAEEWERAPQASAANRSALPARRRSVRIEEQCAVLIGDPGAGWADADAASHFLKTVKSWPLPELKVEKGMLGHDEMVNIGPDASGKLAIKNRVPINPFLTSFVLPNPSMPHQARPQNKYDPAWEKFNKYESFSLLKCPKPYTLAVREYAGTSVVQPAAGSGGFLEKIGLGGSKLGEGLGAAGCQAHALAEFLQKLGFQPYVLHTRTSSVVTVGAFDSPQDPEMIRTQDRLARFSFTGPTHEPINLGLFNPAVPITVPHP
jgi:hypothetical protein